MVSVPMMRGSLGVRIVPLPVAPVIAKSLLVSRDRATIERVTDAMEKLAIATEVCVDIPSARRVIHSKKFDAVTVDFDLGEDARNLLYEIRVSDSNRRVPALAITRSQTELLSAHDAGTNFVLERPLTRDSVSRILMAGYGLFVRERRRYFRCIVRARVFITRIDMRETLCHTNNVSEGGMEICSAPARLTPGLIVHAQFVLPRSTVKFRAACEVRWRNTRNRAGLRFLTMPLEQRCDLQEWLCHRLEESLPDSIAAKFRNATSLSSREINSPSGSY